MNLKRVRRAVIHAGCDIVLEVRETRRTREP
jgi:hypothetical protein